MRRGWRALAAGSLVCGSLLGCGGSGGSATTSTDAFKHKLTVTGARAAPLGRMLVATLQHADRLSDQEVVARFTGFSTQFEAVHDDLAALDPPRRVAGEYRAYLADLAAIEDRLLRDLTAANRHAGALKRQLGIGPSG